jgi:hypothetical protein
MARDKPESCLICFDAHVSFGIICLHVSNIYSNNFGLSVNFVILSVNFVILSATV